jgi:hypothetical protein
MVDKLRSKKTAKVLTPLTPIPEWDLANTFEKVTLWHCGNSFSKFFAQNITFGPSWCGITFLSLTPSAFMTSSPPHLDTSHHLDAVWT